MTVWFPPPEEAAALKEAVVLLRDLEWVWTDGEPSDGPCCAICGAGSKVYNGSGYVERKQHHEGCALDAFLKRWGTP